MSNASTLLQGIRSTALICLAIAWLVVPTACGPKAPVADPLAEDGAKLEAGATEAAAEAAGEDGQEPPIGLSTAGPATHEASGAELDLPTAEAAGQATALAASLVPPMVSFFGVPGSEPGQMTLPFDVALDGEGHVFVSDTTGVTKYTTEGDYVLRLADGEIPVAEGIAVGPEGLVYITGYGALIHVCDPDGPLLRTIGDAGDAPGQLRRPTDIAFDAEGNLLVADAGNQRIEKFTREGRHLQTIGEPGTMSGQFTAPRNVAVGGDGLIYVGQGDDFLVHRFDAAGNYVDAFGKSRLDENMFRTAGVAVDEAGIAYMSRSLTHRIQAFDTSVSPPELLWEKGGLPGYSLEQFNSPGGMEVDGDRLWVADTRNNRVVSIRLR